MELIQSVQSLQELSIGRLWSLIDMMELTSFVCELRCDILMFDLSVLALSSS